MQLWLVRHGQSGGNAESDPGPDPRLTELGQRQAALAAERLSARKFAALHCSPLRRALQTADIIARRLGLAPAVWVELHEKGAEPGLTRSQIQRAFPSAALPGYMPEEQWWKAAGETEEEAYLRAEQLRKRICDAYRDQDVSLLLVTHGTFGSIMISHFLDCHPCGFTRFSQHNCAISRLDLVEGHWRLRFLNATDHLPAEAIT